MASSSKLPITSQETSADQTHPEPVPLHPAPASPNPSDSLDALFHTEKADSGEGSLTSKGKKWGRDDGDAASDTP